LKIESGVGNIERRTLEIEGERGVTLEYCGKTVKQSPEKVGDFLTKFT
jgi:hypothetical protein